MVDVSVAYHISPYFYKKSRSHGGFLLRSLGHRQFSTVVTRSQTVFGWSQILSLVTALSMAHIGVTTPWFTTVRIMFQLMHTSSLPGWSQEY